MSFSLRVENIKVKKVINVSYLNYRESSVFRIFRDFYACERFMYQNVFQIRTFHIFALGVCVILPSCWKHKSQEGNKCFVPELPRVVSVSHVSGFLCMWTFYVSERFPDPYISHIRIMGMCLSLLVLKHKSLEDNKILTWTTESRLCFASFGIPMHVNVLCIRTFSRSVSKVKLATIVEGDPKAPFSTATTPRCRGGRYSIPRIAPLYPWTVPYNAEC